MHSWMDYQRFVDVVGFIEVLVHRSPRASRVSANPNEVRNGCLQINLSFRRHGYLRLAPFPHKPYI